MVAQFYIDSLGKRVESCVYPSCCMLLKSRCDFSITLPHPHRLPPSSWYSSRNNGNFIGYVAYFKKITISSLIWRKWRFKISTLSLQDFFMWRKTWCKEVLMHVLRTKFFPVWTLLIKIVLCKFSCLLTIKLVVSRV